MYEPICIVGYRNIILARHVLLGACYWPALASLMLPKQPSVINILFVRLFSSSIHNKEFDSHA
jgi:hypothetical protein